MNRSKWGRWAGAQTSGPASWSRWAVAGLALAANLADAAETDAPPLAADNSGLEEVVVTARFAKESLQATPIAITALDANALEQRGMDGIVDVAASTPNVTILTGGATNGKTAQAFIRGVGQASFNFAFDPAVGFYVDDVYHGTVFGALFELDDVDRVEVLRGPQGTLFGKSNEGGAVLVYTVKPSGGDTGYAEAGYGNYGHERLRAAYDITVIPDKLFIRVAGASDQSDGWFTRYDYACLNPGDSGNLKPLTVASNCKLGTEGGDNTTTARIGIRYVASDDLEILLRADLLDDRSEADPSKLLAVNNAPGTGINDYNNNVAIPQLGIPLDSRFITNSPYTSYATFQEPSTGRTVPDISEVYSSGMSAVINWNAPGGIHVKNVTAFQHYSGSFGINGAEAPEIGRAHV